MDETGSVVCSENAAPACHTRADTNAEVEKFATTKYAASFPLFAKTLVNTPPACEGHGPACLPASTECCPSNGLVHDLLLQLFPGNIEWNFAKVGNASVLSVESADSPPLVWELSCGVTAMLLLMFIWIILDDELPLTPAFPCAPLWHSCAVFNWKRRCAYSALCPNDYPSEHFKRNSSRLKCSISACNLYIHFIGGCVLECLPDYPLFERKQCQLIQHLTTFRKD